MGVLRAVPRAKLWLLRFTAQAEDNLKKQVPRQLLPRLAKGEHHVSVLLSTLSWLLAAWGGGGAG